MDTKIIFVGMLLICGVLFASFPAPQPASQTVAYCVQATNEYAAPSPFGLTPVSLDARGKPYFGYTKITARCYNSNNELIQIEVV